MEDNLIVELVWALAVLAFPICALIIVLLFKKDISRLLDRIGRNKLTPATKTEKNLLDKDRTDKKPEEKIKTTPPPKKEHSDTEAGGLVDEETRQTIDYEYLPVEVCRNNNSGQYFIVVDESGEDRAKMITPTGKIKILELKLFGEPEIENVYHLHKTNLITIEQLEGLEEHITIQDDKYIDEYLTKQPFSGPPSTPREEEPPYITSYRNMLNNPETFPLRMLQCIREEHSITEIRLKKIMSDRFGYKSETSGSFSASLRVLLVSGYITIEGTGDNKIISITQAGRDFLEKR